MIEVVVELKGQVEGTELTPLILVDEIHPFNTEGQFQKSN